jgi:uncharacterized protein
MQTQTVNDEPVDINNVQLNTSLPMTVGDVLDKTDGVYFCIKEHNSVFYR